MDLDAFQTVLLRGADRVTVWVRGDLDLVTAPRLDVALYEATRADAPADFLVDFTDVGFFDAQALGVLATAAQRLRATGHRLTVKGLTAFQLSLICLCGLDTALSVDRIARAGDPRPSPSCRDRWTGADSKETFGNRCSIVQP